MPPKVDLGSIFVILSRSSPHPLPSILLLLLLLYIYIYLFLFTCQSSPGAIISWQPKDLTPFSAILARVRVDSLQCTPLAPHKSSYVCGPLIVSRTQKNADDVVITLAIRTPLTKAFKGGMKDTSLDFIVYQLLKKVIEKSNIDPQMVEDICLGNVSTEPRTKSSSLLI